MPPTSSLFKIRTMLAAASMLLVAPVKLLAQGVPDLSNLEQQQFALQQEFVHRAFATEQMLYQRLIPLVFAIIVTILVMVFLNQRDKRRKELIAQLADKGRDIPAALLPSPRSAFRDMRTGVWFTSLGVGLGLALYIQTGDLRVAAWSLVLLSLGAAGFINARLFYPKAGSDD